MQGEGTLAMDSWHSHGFCGTTHCRAGWVNHLAGDEGKALEDYWGPDMAALLIYKASSVPGIEVPLYQFYTTNSEALADIERCAKLEIQHSNTSS